MDAGHRDRTTRPGPLRAGFEFQDAHAVGVLVDWLCQPDRFLWVRVEADEFGWIDDIAMAKSDGQLILQQVKCALHPLCPDSALSFTNLLERQHGNRPSLLLRLFSSWMRLGNDRDACLVVLVTNRFAEPALRQVLQQDDDVGMRVNLDRVAGSGLWQTLLDGLAATETELRKFLNVLRFDLEGPDYVGRLQGVKRRFCQTLGGGESDLLRLVEHVRQWSIWKDQPQPGGRITLDHVQSAVGFVACMREDFLALCGDVTNGQIRHFVHFDASRYVHRDADGTIAALANPWKVERLRSPTHTEADWLKVIVAQARQQKFLELWKSVDLLEQVCAVAWLDPARQAIETALRSIRELVRRLETPTEIAKQLWLKTLAEEVEALQTLLDSLRLSHTQRGEQLRTAFLDSISHRSLPELQFCLQEYSQAHNLYRQYWQSLWDGDALVDRQREELWQLRDIVQRCEQLDKQARLIDTRLRQKLVVVLAEGGHGKTWSLCSLARTLVGHGPILLLSARDPFLLEADGFLDYVAHTMHRERPTWGISVQRLRSILTQRLQADEQMCFVLDGVDWMAGGTRASERLQQWLLETESLPVRWLISCRTAYYGRFRSILQDQVGFRLLSTEIGEFTTAEWRRVEDLHGKIEAPTQQHERLFRSPIFLGLCLDLAGSPRSWSARTLPSNLLDLVHAYVAKVVQRACEFTGDDEWWVRLLITTMSSMVLERVLNGNSEGDARDLSALTRGEVRNRVLAESGEYNGRVFDELVSAGLLASDGPRVWFASDVYLEVLIARAVLDRYFPTERAANWIDFERDLDMAREWLPGQIGVMALVAIELAKRGVYLWERWSDAFPQRLDWLNLVSASMPPSLASLHFVEQLLQSNAQSLRQRWLPLSGATSKLLGSFPTELAPESTILDGEPLGITDGPLTLAKLRRALRTDLFREYSYSDLARKPDKLDVPGAIKPEVDFWSEHFPARVIPLIAQAEAPMATRVYLADRIGWLCGDLRLPIELNANIYRAYALAAYDLGVSLPVEDRMRVLYSDDEVPIVQMTLRRLRKTALFQGITEYEYVPDGDGDEALRMITQCHYSLLVIDEAHPGLSGGEVAKRFRRWSEDTEQMYETSIIMSTGYSLGDTTACDYCDGFIQKPYRLEDMTMVVLGYGGRDHRHLGALRHALTSTIQTRASGSSFGH